VSVLLDDHAGGRVSSYIGCLKKVSSLVDEVTNRCVPSGIGNAMLDACCCTERLPTPLAEGVIINRFSFGRGENQLIGLIVWRISGLTH
jgi:hypothetical protein